MYLNQLKYNGKVVGYRISGVMSEGKEVYLDMTSDIAKSILSNIPKEDIRKGVVIPMKSNGRMLVTQSEESAIEIRSVEQGLSYFCNFDNSSSMVEENFDTLDELSKKKIEIVKEYFSKGIIVDNDFSYLYDYDQERIAERRVNYLRKVLEKGGLTRFVLNGFGFTEKYSVELKCDVAVPTVKEYALMLSIIAGSKGLVSKPFKVDPIGLHRSLVKSLGFDGYPVFNDDDDHDWDLDYLFGGHDIECIGDYYLGGLVEDSNVEGKLVITSAGEENLGNVLRATVYLDDKNLKGSREM